MLVVFDSNLLVMQDTWVSLLQHASFAQLTTIWLSTLTAALITELPHRPLLVYLIVRGAMTLVSAAASSPPCARQSPMCAS